MKFLDSFKRSKEQKRVIKEVENANIPLQEKKEVAIKNTIINCEAKHVPTEEKQLAKCNCDGCPNQETCEYGYIIYDEFDGHLSLADKFIFIGGCDVVKPVSNREDIIDTRFLRNKKELYKQSKEKLKNTLYFLQEQKKKIYSIGKCGKAFFKYDLMENEINFVKEVLRDYDSYYEQIKRKESIRPSILKQIEIGGYVLQVDIFKEFADFPRNEIANIIKQMELDEIIVREKSGNTYKLVRHI